MALEIEGSNPSVHPNITRLSAVYQESRLASTFNRSSQTSRRLISFLCLSLVGIVLAAGVAAVACGGGGSDEKAKSIVEKFLEVGQNPGATSEVYLGKLPPGLPDDLPEYPGSSVVGSIAGSGGGTTVFSVLRETGDSVDQVYLFYEQTLDSDPWRISLSASSSKYAALQFASTTDPNTSGSVVVQPTDDSRQDSIIYLTIQTASAESATSEPFVLEPSKPLPHDWPAQMPVYANATITDAAWRRTSTSIEWQITFLAQTTPDDVLAFYRTELTSKGFTTTDEPPQGEASLLSFKNEQGPQTWSGGVSTLVFAQDPTYAQATVQLAIGASATPQPSATPAP